MSYYGFYRDLFHLESTFAVLLRSYGGHKSAQHRSMALFGEKSETPFSPLFSVKIATEMNQGKVTR